jgi:hypothetical protein
MTASIAIRARTAQVIAPTDWIEVYLLDPARESGALGEFPLHPYGPQATTGIHEVKTLAGDPAADLLALWAGTLRDEEGQQAHCHCPLHGLRFFSGEAILYETSLCWVCNNYFAGTGQTYLWLGLPGGYPHGSPTPTCAGLRQLLLSLLPIPESLVRKVSPGGTKLGRARGEYGGRLKGSRSRY